MHTSIWKYNQICLLCILRNELKVHSYFRKMSKLLNCNYYPKMQMYENQKSIFYHIIVQNLYFDGIVVEHSFPRFQVGVKTFTFYIIGNCMIVEETAQSNSCFVMLLLLVYFPYLTSWGNEIKMICIKASKNVSSFISERCYWRGGGTPWDSWNKSQFFLVILKYFLSLILWIFTNENDDQRKKIS